MRNVVAQGKRIRTPVLDVRYVASPFARGRVGLVVPRLGGTAVRRNTLKRRLRELARVELLPTLAATDVVIRAHRGTYGATFSALREQVLRVARQLAGAAS